jgi:hypothetical protein
MRRVRVFLGSIGLLGALLLAACSDDTASSCASGNGATACVRDDGTMSLEGFLPGSTATVTTGTSASGATGTGATATGAAGTNLPVTIGGDGRNNGVVGVLSAVKARPQTITVRGVSNTNRPVNLTLTLR